MNPAVTLPRENEPIVRSPEKLLVSRQPMEDTSPPVASLPNLAAYPCCHIRNAN